MIVLAVIAGAAVAVAAWKARQRRNAAAPQARGAIVLHVTDSATSAAMPRRPRRDRWDGRP